MNKKKLKLFYTFLGFGISTLMFLCVFILIKSHEEQEKKDHASRMESIYLGLCNMMPNRKHLPLTKNQRKVNGIDEEYSWRFELAPWMPYGTHSSECSPDFNFSQPWKSELNYHFKAPAFCWTKGPSSGRKPEEFELQASVMAITGKNTAFDIRDIEKLKNYKHLIFIVETVNSEGHWAKPQDIDIDTIPEDFTSGRNGKGFMVMFLNGDVWYIHKNIPIETLRNFFTIDKVVLSDRNKELLPYATIYYTNNIQDSLISITTFP